MISTLLFLHSLVRWLLLAALLYMIYRSVKKLRVGSSFSKTDNSLRHWTATLGHIQLLIGMWLYMKGPMGTFFMKHTREAMGLREPMFFGIIHSSLMIAAIVLLTIGSSAAKRKKTDREKFQTILLWFSIALAAIFIAIPWPFSPLANRPFIRIPI